MTTFEWRGLPEQHHSLDDCCDLFVLSEFVPVVDQVEHSAVNIVVSLQLPVLVLLDSVPGVVFTEQRPGLLFIPSQWSLDQAPDTPLDRHVMLSFSSDQPEGQHY